VGGGGSGGKLGRLEEGIGSSMGAGRGSGRAPKIQSSSRHGLAQPHGGHGFMYGQSRPWHPRWEGSAGSSAVVSVGRPPAVTVTIKSSVTIVVGTRVGVWIVRIERILAVPWTKVV